VALVRETDDGQAKVSLRSRGDVNVEQIARRHGGGGHKNAAGYVADGEPARVAAAAVEALTAALAAPAAAGAPAGQAAAEPALAQGDGET
jgi:phosphoesterase RecJ-like protein